MLAKYSTCNMLGTSMEGLTSIPSPPPPPPPPSSQAMNTKPETPPPTKSLYQLSLVDIYHQTCDTFRNNSLRIVSFYMPIQANIQVGPTCGIVALSMAGQFFKGSSQDTNVILYEAIRSEYTKSGEMFSSYNMASLAESVLRCKATVITDLSKHKRDILNHICNGMPVLIPYDADKNHRPCLNDGRNAHWAVLCGVCFTVPFNAVLIEGFEKHFKLLYLTRNGAHIQRLLNSATQVFVYAHQGKSKHLALWNFETLLSSNRNMFQVTNKYQTDNMVIPSGDPLSELRDKAVLLKRK